MRLYLASNNEHKRKEFKEILSGYEIILPKDDGIAFDPVEDGSSYIENALIKAEALYSIVRMPVIADDSGLSVEALGKEPGIHTARYGEDCGKKLSDKEKYTLLLKNMEGRENRNAEFICAIAVIIDNNNKYVVQKSVKGSIVHKAEGENGFGYDPVFFNDEAMKVSALLSAAEKNTFSHRAKAGLAVKEILDKEKERIWKEESRISWIHGT